MELGVVLPHVPSLLAPKKQRLEGWSGFLMSLDRRVQFVFWFRFLKYSKHRKGVLSIGGLPLKIASRGSRGFFLNTEFAAIRKG